MIIRQMAIFLKSTLESVRQMPAADFFKLAEEIRLEKEERLKWEAGLAGMKLNF